MTDKNTKKKLCWNCEGRVPFDEENCTYCGVYLSPISVSGYEGDEQEEQAPTPLYRMESNQEHSQEHRAPYQTQSEETTTALPTSDDDLQQMKTVLTPLSLLLSGSVFFLFGLVLFLFSSENGLFTLQWNATLWPYYFVLGIAMLFFGWRTLRHLDEY